MPTEIPMSLAERIKSDLSAKQHRFELHDSFADVTFRVPTAQAAIAKAAELGHTRFQAIGSDGVISQVAKVDDQWVRSDGQPLSAVQEAIDRESISAIASRTGQRLQIEHVNPETDRQMALADAFAFQRIQQPYHQSDAASYMADNATDYPHYKDALNHAIPGYPGTAAKVYALNAEDAAKSEAKEDRKNVEIRALMQEGEARSSRPDLSSLQGIFDLENSPAPPSKLPGLEDIKRHDYPQTDRADVQDAVIKAVLANPQAFISKYKDDPRSFDGRYIAADLFKETFEQFSESKEARNRYNAPVHNSAAVLSAALFRQTLADKSYPERDTVVFLTGIPGAGKTSTVLAAGELDSNIRLVFEGQLANPVTTIEKIQQALRAKLQPVIVAVHARPEDALDNTLKRFNEQGRGASIAVMSQIQGQLPDGLAAVQKHFGNTVIFNVVDYRDRANPQVVAGWQHLDILRSEGNYEQIKQRLSSSLEAKRGAGTITDAAYRQAAGIAPADRYSTLAGQSHAQHEKNAPGRSVPPADRPQADLSDQRSIHKTSDRER